MPPSRISLLSALHTFSGSFNNLHRLETFPRSIFYALISMLCFSTTTVYAQNIQNADKALDIGMRSTVRVNPVTRGVNFQIPLGTYKGRAGVDVPVVLSYSSKLWEVKYQGYAPGPPPPHGGMTPFTIVTAHYSRRSVAGWTSSVRMPSIDGEPGTHLYDQFGFPRADGFCATPCYVIDRKLVWMPDGSSHEIRASDQPRLTTAPAPDNFYSVDGSRMRYQVSTGTLFMPDGSRYLMGPGKYIDRNGNELTYNSTSNSFVDTLGRLISNPLTGAPTVGDQNYSVPGVNGTPMNYVLKWRSLGNVLTTPEPLRYTASSGCPPSTGGTFSPFLFSSDMAGNTCFGNASVLFNPVVLHQIVLPNGQAYTFTYNVYGEIDKVVLPTGGYERYQYGQVPGLSSMSWVYAQTNRGVNNQFISPSGSGADEAHWQYSSAGPGTVFVTAPPPASTRTEFSIWTDNNSNWGYSPDGARAGQIYDQRIYSSSGQMLRRKMTDWVMTGSNGNDWVPTANRNARPVREVEFWLDTGGNALAKTTTFAYDTTFQFNVGVERTSVSEYELVEVNQNTAQTVTIGSLSSIPNGTLIRTATTAYLTNNQAYRDRNILSLPSSVSLYNGSGALIAQTTFAYDEPAYPLISVAGPYTGWTDPATTVRANATSRSQWLNTSGTWVVTHSQYDQFGNVRNVWDARQIQSQVNYSSTFAFAYPTENTSADPDGGGPLTALTTSAEYDFSTGRITATVAPTGQRSTFSYNDPLNRLKQVIQAETDAAIKTQATYSYDDINRIVTITSDKTTFDDNVFKSSKTFDGLGRLLETRTYETASDYIAVKTEYDALGRLFKTSNPHRNGETPAWNTTEYDDLGRIISVTTPDNAVFRTVYSGNRVLVTDQAGKQRLTRTNAMGQIQDLWEIRSADSGTEPVSFPSHPEVTAGYRTSYQYDIFNNLVKVTQGSQQRFFMYDSLQRLIRARHPEEAAYAPLNLSDSLTGNSQWSVAYQYDQNSNLTQKTDPRGIVATYAYDNLNRNITIDYSDTPSISPDVSRFYDGATHGKGRLWYSYAGGNNTVGSNVEYTAIDSYDRHGRPLTMTQKFKLNGVWGPSYQVSRAYDRSGAVTSQTYPSGHSVAYGYDAAGRTTSFTGNLGDGSSRTYSSNATYSPFGGLSKEQFGTNTPLYHKVFYNIRGQLFDTRLSSVNDTWDWNRGRLILYYSSNHIWGQSGTDNNGNVMFAETWIPPENATLDQADSLTEDRYTYDALNRLTSVAEQRMTAAGGWVWSQQFQQTYTYDRFGNRTINAGQTWGVGINNKQFSVDPATNRLGVPAGQSGVMSYDNAGNLTTDSYAGTGGRTYDFDNKMTAAQDGTGGWANYTYNADGQRTRRKISNQETWEIYGFDGELLADYPANGATTSPQKEYGYRSGELLVVAEAAESGGGGGSQDVTWTNLVGVSSSGNSLTRTLAGDAWNAGARSSQSIASGDGYAEFTATETNKKRTVGLTTSTTVTGMHHISYGMHLSETGQISIHEGLGVYGVFGTYTTGDKIRVAVEGGVVKYRKNGTLLRTSTLAPTYPLYAGAALFTNGSTTNAVVPGGGPQNVTWTNLVGVSSSGNSVTRTLAGDAWNAGARSSQSIASGDGYAEFTATETNKRRSFGLTTSTTVSGMHHVTYAIHLGDDGQVTIHEGVAVYGVFGTYTTGDKLRVAIEGGVVKYRKNGTLLRTSTLAPTYPLYAGGAIYSNGGTVSNAILNVGGSSSSSQIFWLVSDHLGTPRMIADQTGSLANIKRHDYLPFGEELFAPTGGRSAAQGYAAGDEIRQQFASEERDTETGLDYFGARYYSSTHGRFTSVDPFIGSARRQTPQAWNRYSYALNNPLAYTDPTGEGWVRGRHNEVFWDPEVSTQGEVTKKYGKGYQLIDGRTLIIYETKGPSPFKVGYMYTFNADGTFTNHGVYLPPSIFVHDSTYTNEMALAVVKLYGSAVWSGATGGTGTLGILVSSAGVAAEFMLTEDGPDPKLAAMAATIEIDQIHDDWVTKGAHLKVDGVEIRVLPGKDGEVVFKSVFSSDSESKVRAAITKARAALADPAFRSRLEKTLSRAVKHFGQSAVSGARAKSGELRFLLKALIKLK